MNKIEEYKKEKDGLDILQDIPHYAAEGWEKITDGDKERLKWAGVFFRRPDAWPLHDAFARCQRLHDRDTAPHHRRHWPARQEYQSQR
jgi:hypothetical protein